MFDAPHPEAAYAHAPEPLAEAADLLTLSTRRAAGYDDVPEREYRLRKAALADRRSLLADELRGPASDAAYDAETDAARTARELGEWDRQHPADVAGPYGPTAIEWDPSQRPYVRQEYAAWTTKRKTMATKEELAEAKENAVRSAEEEVSTLLAWQKKAAADAGIELTEGS
ncbi:hypothetical protein [Streptomyces sp. DW26H14]|uniref:hypothetical protein n=1 Tax=Streptomyces sp. DW26H14 TaxID=3435395 RepID=UPI00403E29A8